MGSPKCPSGHSWAGPSQNTKALLGKPQHDAKADFLGGTQSPRPRIRGQTQAGAFHFHRMVDEEPVTRRAHAPMKRQHSLRACGARPSRGPGPSERPCGENPEMTRRAGFLGGARSPRPCCEAVRKPRHCVIIADELANGRLPCGDMPRLYPGHFCGRAEPAPPGVKAPR
jgi:hypothetical protein